MLVDEINAMSGGRLVVENFPGGAIVPPTKEFEGVLKGVIDAGVMAHAFNKPWFPQSGLFFQVVGGMRAPQFMMWFEVGGGHELAAKMWATLDVVYVGTPLFHPPEIWCHSAKPLESLADLKGFKMRTAGDAAEILSRMGASPVFLAPPEIYEAQARGVIDGLEYGGLHVNWAFGFHEIAEYIYLSPSRAPTATSGFAVRQDVWAELPPDLQRIVENACRVVALRGYAEELVLDYIAYQKYVDYGIKVYPLPEDIEREMLRIAEEYYEEEAAKDPFYAEILQSQREFRKILEFHDLR
jgi:TRAP-type mannitol/chloroaromatic compound transport system substrate-binding protein